MYLATIYRKIVGDMKLQLDESTLNAYINEAITQELLSETCYKVDFTTLGKPVNPQTKPMKAKVINALKSGAYGKNNPRKLVAKLREVGYSDEQIQTGIRNGAIQVAQSFDPASGQAALYDVKKQNKKLQKLLNAANGYMYDYNQSTEEPEDSDVTTGTTSETTPSQTTGTTPTEPATGFPWDGIAPEWTPRAPKRTTPARTSPKATEPETTTPEPAQERKPIEPIPAQPSVQLPQALVQNPQQQQIITRQPQQPGLAAQAISTMNKTANQSDMSLGDRISTNRRTRQNANNTIDQMVKGGSMTRQQARDDKRLMKDAEKALRNGQ